MADESYVTPAESNNINRIIDKLLTEKLTPARIRAFAFVIQSLGGQRLKEPNQMPVDDLNETELDSEMPMNLKEIQGFQIEGNKEIHPIKIYG